jgi:hypothetical protein
MPIKRIAALLGVSPSSVHRWTRDIELSAEHRHRNLYGPRGPHNPEHIAARMRPWSERNRANRRSYQASGRASARELHPFHSAGCMLFWAEGSKNRNTVCLTNSDADLVRFFCGFLRRFFEVPSHDFTVRLHVYLGNGLTVSEIEDSWLRCLELPRTVLRKHAINVLPTSSSGRKKNKLPYGVCTPRPTEYLDRPASLRRDPTVRRVRPPRVARLTLRAPALRWGRPRSSVGLERRTFTPRDAGSNPAGGIEP